MECRTGAKQGKCGLKMGWKTVVVAAKEFAENPNFRSYQVALGRTIAASLQVVAARAKRVNVDVIDVVLAGGGSHLPFLPSLVQAAG